MVIRSGGTPTEVVDVVHIAPIVGEAMVGVNEIAGPREEG